MNRSRLTVLVAISAFVFATGCNLICDTDDLKGLVNEGLQCEGGVYDESSGLCWQHPSVCCYEWQEAVDYCDTLTLAGHSDWYLPGKQDIMDLLGDCDADLTSGGQGYCDSCNNSASCFGFFGYDEESYWINLMESSTVAWDVHFSDGWVKPAEMYWENHVRCVRAE